MSLRYGWGCAVHSPLDDQIFRDYWSQEELCLDISSREMLALVYAIKALPDGIKDCRIDASIDSMAVLGAWQGSGSRRSPQLTSATKRLYFALSSRNVQLNLSYVPSKENVADFPSRTMSRVDSKLSMSAFEMVDKEFGGVEGHSFDLMSLDSNVMKNKDGIPLPHFTPFPSPDSNGVNVFSQDLREFPSMSNPYVFPPFSLIGPLMKFLLSFKIPFTIVVPEFVPHRYWWVELNARCSGKICLGTQGDLSVLLSPSKSGYSPTPCPFPFSGRFACLGSRCRVGLIVCFVFVPYRHCLEFRSYSRPALRAHDAHIRTMRISISVRNVVILDVLQTKDH